MLGSKRRFVILRDQGRLLPKPGPLAQMSQTAATVNSWEGLERGSKGSGTAAGQPHKHIRCPPPAANRAAAGAPFPASLSASSRRGTSAGPQRPGERRGGGPMPEPGFAVPLLLRFATLAVEGLAAAREEIDALNVYPVPDGDTGTNLL